MSFQSIESQQVLYEANPYVSQTLNTIRDHVQNICSHHINHLVSVRTNDDQVFEGTIVNCERGILYLRIPNQGAHHSSSRVNYYSDVILPLVLFELLVITLLYT